MSQVTPLPGGLFMVDGEVILHPPPPGYVIDFDNPVQRTVPSIYISAGILIFLTLLFMAQRVVVRVVQRRIVFDDVLVFVALVLALYVTLELVRLYKQHVFGLHLWEMPLERFQDFSFYLWCLPAVYMPLQGAAKMSLLLLYRRLAPQRWYQILNYCVMFIVIAYTVIIFFATIFMCAPIRAAYDVSITDARCLDKNQMYYATAAMGVATDILVLLVPIPVVVRLQIPRIQKFGLVALFCIGSVTVVTSLVRLILLLVIKDDSDATWGVSPALLWIVVESNLFVICASLPSLKQFFGIVAPHIIDSSTGDRSAGDSNLVTFGRSSDKKKRGYLRDPRIDTTVAITVSDNEPHKAPAAPADHERDNNSEKAIMTHPKPGYVQHSWVETNTER